MGMMGASLSAALRKQSNPPNITGVVRSLKSRDWISSNNLADAILLSEETQTSLDIKQYDLIVLGMPISANAELLKSFSSIYKSATPDLKSNDPQSIYFSGLPLITDMSSTRTYLEELVSSYPELPFIGSHPMCGSADAGPSAYRDTLFEDRLVILIRSTMRPHPPQQAFQALNQFWTSLGCRASELNERDHDLVLAYLSHAPHLVSSLLATVTANRSEVRRINSNSPIPITGGGLRDMLRIAGSNPEMWKDILHTNRKYILESLRDFRTGLDELIDTVESDSMEWWSDWQNQSRVYRNEICGYDEKS